MGAGSIIDTVLLVIVEANRLRWAVEQVICESIESSDFLVQHKFLDRWSDEQKLEEDLKPGLHHPPPESDQIMYAFLMEINSAALHESAGESGSVFIEILPGEALQRSWWINLMQRTADGQPQYGDMLE